MINCHLSFVVALRAIDSSGYRAKGASANDKWQLNIEQ